MAALHWGEGGGKRGTLPPGLTHTHTHAHAYTHSLVGLAAGESQERKEGEGEEVKAIPAFWLQN